MSDLADLSLDEVIRLTSISKVGGNRGRGGSRQGRPRGVHKRPERPIYSDRSRSGRINFGSRRGFRRPNQAGGNNRSGDSPPTRLIVDNLADTVTQVDVEELFSEFGNLVGVSMHYDKAGRSTGTAHVTFTCQASGLRAIQKYNGCTLDGVAMTIQMTPTFGQLEVEPIPSPTTSSNSSGSSSMGSSNGSFSFSRRGRNFNRRGPNFNRRGSKFELPAAKSERPIPSESQLDDDLDEYMANRKKTKQELDREMESYKAQNPGITVKEEDTAMLYD